MIVRVITVGAVLWLSDRVDLKDRLRMEVRRAFADVDLTGEHTRALVAANDEWAAAHGAIRNAASAEGWSVYIGADQIATRTGSWWPSHRRSRLS